MLKELDMKKVYISSRDICYFRIGRALIKIEFKNGIYETGTEIFQRAIEASELFRSGIVKLKETRDE